MKFIPILYQTLMVQAIQQGSKTKTRRLKGLNRINEKPGDWDLINYFESDFGETITFQFVSRTEAALLKFPFGKVGDVLWVRESVCPGYYDDNSPGYKADWNDVAAELVPEPKWKPSIHMPKTACRIFLEITGITVERLQDISEEDAIAEGILIDTTVYPNRLFNYQKDEWQEGGFPSVAFTQLWKMINGATSWDANPWVWVISFKKIDKPVNFI